MRVQQAGKDLEGVITQAQLMVDKNTRKPTPLLVVAVDVKKFVEALFRGWVTSTPKVQRL